MVSTGDQLAITPADLEIRSLGPQTIASPIARLLHGRASSIHYVHESDRVLLDDTLQMVHQRGTSFDSLLALEPGGPRAQIYFAPERTKVGIVTCGGLCPGLNDVIRGLVLELHEHYGVPSILGFRNGYLGLVGEEPPLELTPESVRNIHTRGGTMLGTSRGDQDPEAMVDTLVRHGVCVLFVIGGDGTLRGAQKIVDVAEARGVELAVVGIPKTIDNDIPYIDHSFGFQTAFARAAESIRAAHTEASSTPNGVGLVKLMGRHSGFIACYAALANQSVDVVLVPEIDFALDGPGGVLEHVRSRVESQGHAVVVVAEGAGQEHLRTDGARDASGNLRLGDIGQLLRDSITAYFAEAQLPLSLRYVDPGYAIRSVAANPYDAVYCIRLAQVAVHAAMAGRTSMVVGRWHGRFVHLPITLATGSSNQVDAHGDLWMSVLEGTGQPLKFGQPALSVSQL
ncbi:MAG TPA: ATP-dependent 6-phosphofructokinase [Jatrophihabitans sp.]|jgi:6-phosphofructokinase 1